jgi:DNA polymerase III subunit delta
MAKAGGARTALGYKELKAEMRAGQSRSLYVLFGDEPFLIDKLVESLGQALIAPGCESLDRVVLDGGGQAGRLDLERLKAEVMTPPFLSAKKLVIVRNSGLLSAVGNSGRSSEQTQDAGEDAAGTDEPGSDARPFTESQPARGNLKNRQEQLAAILEKLPDSVCLVMIEAKVDKRQKQLVSLIEQKGALAEIGQEEPRVLRQWVEAECLRRGLQIAADAAESLIDRCDNSMQVIWQEMGKLFLFCDYAGSHSIELPLIAEISLPDLRGSIFDLTDALSDGRTERALQLVDTLIGQKEPVQLIQFMLARHLRQLICAAELGRPERITTELKVMPFVANRLARQARRLPIPVLEDLYARCVDTDTQVKTGRIGDRLALETYLAEAAEKVKFAVGR